MTKLNFNPVLLSVLTKRDLEDISSTPSVSDLPGRYVQLVSENSKNVPRAFPQNAQMLRCGNCKKKSRYDVGHITVNLNDFQKDRTEDPDKHIQSNGYFRCKSCNSAGNWEITNEYQVMLFSALITLTSQIEDELFSIGENQLFDGSSHRYSTDAEEHLLHKIINHEEDALLWNRLGNLYFKGGRADLAIAAFEHSLSIDPLQTESLYSIGMILEEIEPNEAASFYHKMLITAPSYTIMDAKALRDLLSFSLRNLVYLNSASNGEISVIPSPENYEELCIDVPNSNESQLIFFDGTLDTEDINTFYPLAELFMGKRRNELPKMKTSFVPKKKKPNQKKKRK